MLSSEGEILDAADIVGAVLLKARADKETKYPELIRSGGCRLVVLAIEPGGRWSDEAVRCSGSSPKLRRKKLHRSCASKCRSRGNAWTRMLAVACAKSFAASMVEPARHVTWCATGWDAPHLADLCESDPR